MCVAFFVLGVNFGTSLFVLLFEIFSRTLNISITVCITELASRHPIDEFERYTGYAFNCFHGEIKRTATCTCQNRNRTDEHKFRHLQQDRLREITNMTEHGVGEETEVTMEPTFGITFELNRVIGFPKKLVRVGLVV